MSDRTASIISDVSSSLVQLGSENVRLFRSIAATLKLVESVIGIPDELKEAEEEKLSAALKAVWNLLIPHISSELKKWDLPTTD